MGHEASHCTIFGLRRELRAPPGCAPGISVHRSTDRRRHSRSAGIRVEPEAAISLRAMRTIIFLSHPSLAVVACPVDPLFNLAWIRSRANIHQWVETLTDSFGWHKCYRLTPRRTQPACRLSPAWGWSQRSGSLLMRSQDGFYCETNSLSLRSGERVRGAREIRDRFQAIFSRFSPLPGPLPARSSRGEGEDEAPPAPRTFVVHPTDSFARRFLRFLRRPLRNSYGFRFQNFPGMVR